jgi:hypothetical protein
MPGRHDISAAPVKAGRRGAKVQERADRDSRNVRTRVANGRADERLPTEPGRAERKSLAIHTAGQTAFRLMVSTAARANDGLPAGPRRPDDTRGGGEIRPVASCRSETVRTENRGQQGRFAQIVIEDAVEPPA